MNTHTEGAAASFSLRIDLGNDTMSTPADIANALRRAAWDVQNNYTDMSGIIRDENGNTVGEWSVQA